MRLRTSKPEDTDLAINVTSMVDVVLILLIFFILTTSFVRQSQLAIHLPEASSGAAAPAAAQPQLEVSVTARGGYYVNGRALVDNRPETLSAAIRQVSPQGELHEVTINADGQATHQSVITAMDVVGRLGFTDVHLATQRPRRPD
jgi:biopolymer transport protein ExbD